jgi:hypothetical protein
MGRAAQARGASQPRRQRQVRRSRFQGDLVWRSCSQSEVSGNATHGSSESIARRRVNRSNANCRSTLAGNLHVGPRSWPSHPAELGICVRIIYQSLAQTANVCGGETVRIIPIGSADQVIIYHPHTRAFAAAMGVPPHRYVSRRRLESAKAMITTRRASLYEIALACRFSSQWAFTRAFRRATGVTPAEYRRTTTIVAPTTVPIVRNQPLRSEALSCG